MMLNLNLEKSQSFSRWNVEYWNVSTAGWPHQTCNGIATGGTTCLVSTVFKTAVLGNVFYTSEMKWEKQRKAKDGEYFIVLISTRFLRNEINWR